MPTTTNVREGKTPGYDIDKVLSSGLLGAKSPVSFNPALERDVLLETADDNFAHTLHNSIADIKISALKGNILDRQIEKDGLIEKLNNKQYASEDERSAIIGRVSDLNNEIIPTFDKIDEYKKDIDDHYITSMYSLDTYASQQEENSALRDYLGGEFAQDLGGSLSELTTQGAMLAASGARPLVKKLVTAVATRAGTGATTGPAAPFVAGALLAYDAATFLGGMWATYNMRRRETQAEKSTAYDEKVNTLLQQRAYQLGIDPTQLNEDEQRAVRLEAAKGLQAVDDINMNLGVADFIQAAALVTPFGRMLGKVSSTLGGGKLAAEIVGGVAKTPFEIFSEGVEEGVQYLASEKYKRGDYDQYQGGGWLDGYKENLNLASTTTQAALGLSQDALTNTPEFRNSFRSGLIIGGVLGGPVSLSEVGKEGYNYYKTKKDLYDPITKSFDPFVNSRISDEEQSTKIDRIVTMNDKGRSKYINDVISNSATLNKEITQEDIKSTQKLVDKTLAAINYVDNSKAFAEISEQKGNPVRNQAVKLLTQAQLKVEDASKALTELEKQNTDIYSELSREASNYVDKDKREAELHMQLATVQQERLSKTFEQRDQLRLFEQSKQDKIKELQSLQLDEAGLLEQIGLLDKGHAEKASEFAKEHTEALKAYDAQISHLETNLRTFAYEHINISNPEVQRVNETKNAQKSLIKQIELYQALVDKSDANEEDKNSTDNKARKELIPLLKDQLQSEMMKEIAAKTNLIRSVLPEEERTDKEVKAVYKRVEDVIKEVPEDKQSKLSKNTSDATQLYNDVKKFSDNLKQWKNNLSALLTAAKNSTEHYDTAVNKKQIVQEEVRQTNEANATEDDIIENINPEDDDIVTDKPVVTIKDEVIEINSPLASINDAIGYSHAVAKTDKDGNIIESDIVSRDKEFNNFISTFANKNELDKAKVVFSIDKEDIGKDVEWLINNAKISIKIVLPDGKIFDNGLVMHTPQYVYNESTKVSHLSIPMKVLKGDSKVFKTVESYINAHKNIVAKNRKEIINLLKNPNITEVYVEGVGRTAGHFNNVGKQQGIYKAWSAKDGQLIFRVGDSNGNPLSKIGDTSKADTNVTPGTVYVTTNKTCNGSETLVKVNTSNLTEEHAGILYDAIVARVKSKDGQNALFGDTGLKISEIIDLLSLEGYSHTLDAGVTPENLSKVERARYNKQLWRDTVEEDGKKVYILHFGGNEIRGYNTNNEDKQKEYRQQFIAWANQYKNYPVRLYNPTTNLGILKLNEPVTKSFKIGNWEFTYDAKKPKTWGEVLASVPVDGKNQFIIQSDIEEFENTGSIMHSPVAMMTREGKGADGAPTSLVIKSNLTKEKVTPKKVTPKAKPQPKPVITRQKTKDDYIKITPDTELQIGSEIYVEIALGIAYDYAGTVLEDGFFDPFRGYASTSLKNLWKELDKQGLANRVYIEVPSEVDVPTESNIEEVEQYEEEVIAEVGNEDVTEETTTELPSTPEVKTEIVEPTVKPKKHSSRLSKHLKGNDSKVKPRLTNWAKSYYNKADVKREVEEIGRMLGKNFSIKIVDDFINILEQGSLAFGTFERDLITLAQMMESGTGYHEAMHRVTNLLLDGQTQLDIYRQARVRYGSKLKEAFGDKRIYSNEEVDEVIAEEFRKYVLAEESKRNTLFGSIKNLFDKILNWIKYYVFKRNPMSKADIDAMFAAVYSGKFRYSKVNKNNYDKLGLNKLPRLARLNDIPSIDTAEQLDKMVKSLATTLLYESDMINLADVDKIQWSTLLEFVKELQENALAESMEEGISSEAKTNWLRLNDLYADVAKYWNTDYRPLIETYLKSLNVNIKEALNEEEDFSIDIKEDNWISKMDTNTVEIDSKNKALPAIKFMIAVLPDSYELDPFTGLENFTGFEENWRALLRELHHLQTFEEMYSKVSDMAETSDKWNTLKVRLDESNTMIKNQFFQVMNKHRHNFVNLNYKMSKEGSERNIAEFYLIDALLQNEANGLINRKNGGAWGISFQNSSLIKRETGKPSRVNLEAFQKLNTEYRELLKETIGLLKPGSNASLTDLQNKFINLLGKLGISIDNDTLDYAVESNAGADLHQKYYNLIASATNLFNPKYSSIYKYQENIDKGKQDKEMNKLNLATVLADESFVTKLGKDHIRAHLYKANDMVYGPAGKPFYVYSDNNIVSDTITDLNTSKEAVETKLSAVNNAHSYILNAIKDSETLRKSLRVVTFSAFDQEESSEESLEYLGMNEIENYLMKMLSSLSGYLPFPVLASKKLYYMFDGVKGFGLGDDMESSSVEVDGKLQFSDKVVDVFYGYFEDEKNRIDKVNEDLRNAERVDVYGNIYYDLTNLTQFVHYNKKGDDIILDSKADVQWDYLTSKYVKGYVAGNNYITFADIENNVDITDEAAVKEYIQNTLQDKVNEELKEGEKLGLVKQEGGNWLNERLPVELVLTYKGESKSKAAKIAFTSTNGIKAMFADSMINQMIGVIETEKLVSGDPICYKPTKKTNTHSSPVDDQIKRLSVLSSTGAKGVTSMIDPFMKDGQPYDKDLTSTQYSTITLKSNKQKAQFYQDLVDIHKGIYMKQGLDEKEARHIAESTLGGYLSTDTTDAQAFIIPMMYRQIKMRLGEWSNDKQEAFEVLMSDRDLSAEELFKYRKFFMEPLKLVYFGHNIPKGGIDTVTYDKMSLATLFPRDIKGYQIENLYNSMNSRGIHMLKFDSAIKAGVQGDHQGFYTADETETIDFNKVPSKLQDWKYLRRQLMTDVHEEDHQKVGTQMIKIILSNIMQDEIDLTLKENKDKVLPYKIDGVRYNGKELIANIYNALKTISNNNKQKIFDKFGMRDEKSIVDDALLIDWLKEEAEKGKMPHAVIESLFTEEGSKANALDLLAKRDWIINRLISYVSKETVDITLPGKALVQQSNIGFRTGESDELKFYSKGERDDLVSMECEVSIGLFKNVIPNYSKLTDEERKAFVLTHPELLGYRIPTQGQSSIVSLVVKRFLSESAGDVIILPRDFTTLTGSDFDIDKLYAIRYNYRLKEGKPEVVPFNIKGKEYYNTEEGKLETKVKNGEISREEAEIALNDSKSFNTRYKAKIRELFATYRNLLATKGGDEFRALNEEIEASFAEQDKLQAKIAVIKTEARNLELRAQITGDQNYNKLAYNKLEEIHKLRAEDNAYYDAIIEHKLNKSKLFDKIGEVLVAEGKLKNKVDFLLASEFEQNLTKAVENRLISSMFSVIKSHAHILHTTKPLDSLKDNLQGKAAEISRETYKNLGSLERLTPKFQSKIKKQYGTGKMGVPFAALHNVHHAIAQTVGLGIYDTTLPVGEDYVENGVIVGKRLDLQKGEDGRFISDWINALLNAFVDIEKDPYIISLNINSTTYPTTYLLLRLGLGEKTFDFMSQYVLKKLATYDAISGKIVNGYQARPLTKYDNYKDAYKELHSEIEYNLKESLNAVNLKLEDLADSDPFNEEQLEIGKFGSKSLTGKPLAQYWKNQLVVLDTFAKLKTKADKLQELVTISQIDTKKFGSNNVEMNTFINRMNGVLSEGLFINQDKLFDETHLGTLLDNSVTLVQNILNNKMIEYTDGYQMLYDTLLKTVGREFTTDSKVVKILAQELYTQIISEFFTSKNYLGFDESKVDELFYVDNSIANRVYNIQAGKFLPDTTDKNKRINKWLKERKIFSDLLMPEFPENQPAHLRVAFRKDADINPDLVMESFKDLFMNNEPEIKKLAQDLLAYSYFASGRKMGVFSIFQHISPKEYGFLHGENNISYNDFLKSKLDELQTREYSTNDAQQIVRSTIKNAWHLNSVVPSIFKTNKYKKEHLAKNSIIRLGSETGYPRIFKVSNMNDNLFLGYNKAEQPIYKPYVKSWMSVEVDKEVKYIQVLGEYVGYDTVSREPVYQVVHKTSINSKGNVVKENGLTKGRVFMDEIPEKVFIPDVEQYIRETISKYTNFKNIQHVSVEDQIVTKKKIEVTEEKTETKQSKVEKMVYSGTTLSDYIMNLSDDDKIKLLKIYKESNPGIETIGDILHEESGNINDEVAIKVLENMLHPSTITQEQLDKINDKHKTSYTMDQFDELSEEIKRKTLNCL